MDSQVERRNSHIIFSIDNGSSALFSLKEDVGPLMFLYFFRLSRFVLRIDYRHAVILIVRLIF